MSTDRSTHGVHFATIDELREFCLQQGFLEQTQTALSRQLQWELVRANPPSEKYKLLPSNPPPALFRGESQQHETCYAACARGISAANSLTALPENEQTTIIENLVRTEWFNDNLRAIPACENRMSFDETAIAQHYGLPTGYVDLSQSFDVAAFFACCYEKNGEWQPVDQGEGVIYIVDRQNPACTNVKPIPLHVFPRPSAQRAWVCEMMLGQDFALLPYVHRLVFRHNAMASRRVLERFDRGKALFPPDPYSQVAQRIRSHSCLPISVAERVVEDVIRDDFGLPGAEVEAVLAMIERGAGKSRIELSASQSVSMMDDEVKDSIRKIWDRFPWEDVGIRLVRTRR